MRPAPDTGATANRMTMRLYRGFGALPAGFGPAVVAMGNFDGVHLGHRAVIAGAVASARSRGVLAAIVTFHPHPLRILAPERSPLLIQSLEDRIACLEASGVDAVVLVPFTRLLASIDARTFVEDYLMCRLGCVELRVGGDARFGHARAGDVDMLRRFAATGALDVLVTDAVIEGGIRSSSSEIRRRVIAGNVEGARVLLGRPFSLAGEVVTGAARGRRLGFPTANLLPDVAIRPAAGIYAAIASGSGWQAPAAVDVGPIPTFGVPSPVVEAHLIGFDGELPGTRMRIDFLVRLRDVVAFADVEQLKRQIAVDVAATLDAVGDVQAGRP